MRRDASGPNNGTGWQSLTAGEAGTVGGHFLQRRLEANVDAASTQLTQRVISETDVDLGQDPPGRLNQHPAHPVETGAWIALHRVGGKVLKLGECLKARVSTTDEDVGEQLVAAGRIFARVRRLQRLDHMVAQPDRVGQALEADRMLSEARYW